jgi:hypothetical protein
MRFRAMLPLASTTKMTCQEIIQNRGFRPRNRPIGQPSPLHNHGRQKYRQDNKLYWNISKQASKINYRYTNSISKSAREKKTYQGTCFSSHSFGSHVSLSNKNLSFLVMFFLFAKFLVWCSSSKRGINS